MNQLTEAQPSLSYESPGLINSNAYLSVALDLCKQSLLTAFKLSYRGGNQNLRKFVNKNKIYIPSKRYHDLYTKYIDDYDVAFITTLLVNPKICDLGEFAYYTTNKKLSKDSLLTAFKLSYKGAGVSQDPRQFVKKRRIWMDVDIFQDLKKAACIDEYTERLLKTLLENTDICDTEKLIQAKDKESGESIMVKCFCYIDYSHWDDTNLHGKNGMLPSLEFWIRKVVKIKNECSHNQEEQMTENLLNKKLDDLKETLLNFIQGMKTHYNYPDKHSKDKIDRLETILIERKITVPMVPIWKDLTASVEGKLMEKVFECISKDIEIDIRLPALENEEFHLDVRPSKVYLNIKGENSNRRKISCTNLVKELRDPQTFPNRCMVLVGLPGVGKTTSLFRMKEEHKYATIKNNMHVAPTFEYLYREYLFNIEDIEVLVYQEMRNNKHKSLSELLQYKFGPATEMIIPHSRQLQHIILSRPSIILLDAIDECSAVSDQLVRDIWHTKTKFPNLYVIFTTRESTSNNNILKECAGGDYDSMCINVTGLDASEFLENAEKLIDAILGDRRGRERNARKRKLEAMSNLQKIRHKFPPIDTNPLLLTIAVRLVLDPFIDTVDKLQSTTQILKGMMESLKRRLCDSININSHIVDDFLEFLGETSLGMLQRNEMVLNLALTEKLTDKIKSLKIDDAVIDKVLQSFLIKKGENVFQHLHIATQSFLAANALFKKMQKLNFWDLDNEINEQMKDIPKENQQTVLMYLVGILHDNEQNYFLNRIASNICRYFEFPMYNYSEFDAHKATHMHLFQESLAGGCGIPNYILEREILSKTPDSINMGEEALEAIEYIMNKNEKKHWPKEITITIQSHPDYILKLKPVLELLKKRNSCLKLEVNQCSETLLSALPENLETLTLQWTMGEADKMIEALNTRLPRLIKLYMLTIYLKEGDSLPEEGLPNLCYAGDWLLLNLEIRFNNNDVVKEARIMGWVSNQRNLSINELILNNSPLSGSCCTKQLNEISSVGVKKPWLKVQRAQLSEGERENLNKKTESIRIKLYVPPGDRVILRGSRTVRACSVRSNEASGTTTPTTGGRVILRGSRTVRACSARSNEASGTTTPTTGTTDIFMSLTKLLESLSNDDDSTEDDEDDATDITVVTKGAINIRRDLAKLLASFSNDDDSTEDDEDGATGTTVPTEGSLPIHYAAIKGNFEVAVKYGDTPLHSAASCGNWDMSVMLLKEGVNIAAKNTAGLTATGVATSKGQTELAAWLHLFTRNSAAAVKQLRNKGPNTIDKILNSKNHYFCQQRNGLEIRVLLMQELKAVDGNIKKMQFGKSNNTFTKGKLIFVGETGSGKTTLVNSMINNILGVKYEDKFRYSVCDLNNKLRSESESQTDVVTEYTFNYINGAKIPCNCVFVDTPGLEDTRGLQIQKENIKQILMYIGKHPSKVGLVIQSSESRLTPHLKSILLDIKSMIETGKVQSLIILATSADSNSPSVKDVLDSYDIPYSRLYLFNNNALYSKNQDITEGDRNSYKNNWNASNRSIDKLLDFLGNDEKAEVKRIQRNKSKDDICSLS